MNAQYLYLLTVGLWMTCAWLVGVTIGRHMQRTEDRRNARRRQVLTELALVDAEAAARRRHPSRLP